MLRNCQGSQRQRLLTKFTENDLEKVDRLMELHFKYLDKVDKVEQEIEQERQVCIIFLLNMYVIFILAIIYIRMKKSREKKTNCI